MDKKVKKKVLQQIPYGAYIVGTQTEDQKDWLMFGTWLMQTSFKPPLVAFAFRKDSRTLANVRRSKSFAVSFLREGSQDLAELVLDGAFEKVKTDRTASGLPVLADGAGWVKMAVGAVFRTEETTMIVAPNSAMLRDRTRTDPATRPGFSWGRVIVRKTCRRFAPRLRAALSRWVSSLTSTAAIERTM